MMKGGESDGDKMALKRGWKGVGRRRKREALAEAGASFFVVCRMGKKRRFLSLFWNWGYNWGYRKGLHLMEKGVTKSGNEGVDGKGVKVRIF